MHESRDFSLVVSQSWWKALLWQNCREAMHLSGHNPVGAHIAVAGLDDTRHAAAPGLGCKAFQQSHGVVNRDRHVSIQAEVGPGWQLICTHDVVEQQLAVALAGAQ